MRLRTQGVLALGAVGLIGAVLAFRTLPHSESLAKETVQRGDVILSIPQPSSTRSMIVDPSTTTRAKLERLVREPIPKQGEFSIRVPVLMYHHIRALDPTFSPVALGLSVTPEHFASHMKELVDLGYHTITPHELYLAIHQQATLPEKPVLISFDDGHRDQYKNAWPILQKYHLKATFFVISGYLSYAGYLDAGMIRELDRSGLITIASHTRHHVSVPSIKPERRLEEVQGSKKDLEKVVNHPVVDFAYPYGAVNGSTEDLVADSGYEIGFSTYVGSLHASSSLMELRRVRVLDEDTLAPLLERFSDPVKVQTNSGSLPSQK